MINELENWIIPITSLVFSIVAFLFTLKNEWSKRSSLDILLLDDPIECLVDRYSNDNPDVYYLDQYRLFVPVVITNKSSLPCTITELGILGSSTINIFSEFGVSYETTYKANDKEQSGSIFTHAYTEKVIGFSFEELTPLQPVFTIKPFESVSGMLIFPYKESLAGVKHKLTITTSRGTISKEIIVSKQYISQKITGYVPPRQDLFSQE